MQIIVEIILVCLCFVQNIRTRFCAENQNVLRMGISRQKLLAFCRLFCGLSRRKEWGRLAIW